MGAGAQDGAAAFLGASGLGSGAHRERAVSLQPACVCEDGGPAYTGRAWGLRPVRRGPARPACLLCVCWRGAWAWLWSGFRMCAVQMFRELPEELLM